MGHRLRKEIVHLSCDLISTNLRWYREIPNFPFNLAFHSKQSYTHRCKSSLLPMQVCYGMLVQILRFLHLVKK